MVPENIHIPPKGGIGIPKGSLGKGAKSQSRSQNWNFCRGWGEGSSNHGGYGYFLEKLDTVLSK